MRLVKSNCNMYCFIARGVNFWVDWYYVLGSTYCLNDHYLENGHWAWLRDNMTQDNQSKIWYGPIDLYQEWCQRFGCNEI